ncbi:restriction endonuclease subunit S [Paenibacillus lautus]
MNAPKVRFQDFLEDWKIIKLSSLMSFNNGINAEKESYGHGRKFINVLDILNNKFIKYNDIIGSISVSEKVQEKNKVEYGDLLFLRSSETREDVGKSSVYLDEDEFALFGGFVIRGKKQADYHPYFLKLNLESPKVRIQISSKAGGSTRFNVSQSILNSIEINIPSQNEQEKIADFISHFDKLIHLQQEKIDLLKMQKKGYMQKIFSQQLRFKDEIRQEYPEWTSDVLEHLGTFGASYSFSRAIEGEGDYFHIHYGDIHSNLPTVCENITFPTITEKRDFELIKENDILFADASEDYADLGKAILIKSTKSPKLIAGLHTHKFTVNEKLNPLYFIYFTQTEAYKEFIRRMGTGISVLGISKSNLNKLVVPLPSVEEQKKISELLYFLDKKIAAETKKIKEIKYQYQAFMQTMFI